MEINFGILILGDTNVGKTSLLLNYTDNYYVGSHVATVGIDFKFKTIKVKEYDYNGELIFEGEYLNGLRNGKGKEYGYFHGKLKFEGEYLNGLKNGNGKEYWNGILIFEGEYLNGLRKGKEYDYDGKLEFEGEYLNGELL